MSEAEAGNWEPNSVVGNRYRITRLVASTERYEIFEANELQPPHDIVIIKRLRLDKLNDADAQARFEREVKALRQIRSEHVISYYDAQTTGDDRYLVIEFADIGTLKQYLKTKPKHKLTPVEALEIAISVCTGLEATHRRNIVHRDIKPGNILLVTEPARKTMAKVADFGLARVPSDEPISEIMKEKEEDKELMLCTPAYASPEQLAGDVADFRSDLYCWGVTFFQMLTGETPIQSLKDPITYRPTSDEFSLSFFTERGVPTELAEVLQKALHKDRQYRYQTTKEVLNDLKSIQSRIINAAFADHLRDGEADLRDQEWQAADAVFQKGLALCGWFGELDELPAEITEWTRKLRTGSLCAQGMIHFSERRWQAAIEALEQVGDPQYADIDIVAQLKRARSELQREQDYQRVKEFIQRKEWAQALDLSAGLNTEYRPRPSDESIGEIRKLARYALGQQLLEEREFESAYRQLYQLYEDDRNNENVAELTAKAAFLNATQGNASLSKQHRAEWLERVINISPNFNDGRARRLLDRDRHDWVTELLGTGKKADAVAVLEQISQDYAQRAEVLATLGQVSELLGQEAWDDKRWRDAARYWRKASAATPTVKGKLRWRTYAAQGLTWLDHKYIIIGLVLTIITIVVGCPQLLNFVSGPATTNPTPSAMPTTVTVTHTITSTPTITATTSAATATPTATRTRTPTPSHTATYTPSPTPTDTSAYTRTPTRTLTRPRTSTPTPTLSPTPTPTEQQPEEPTPTPPTPPPTPPTPPTL